MRQFLVRLLAFLVVILVIFGLYRLITVQPLKPSDFFAQATKAPLVIADTGRLTQAPPYTLAALDAAQQAGADGFYLPVQLTRDGELVVLGQADLSQLTERNEPVSQLTLAEVQGLDAGYRFDPAGDGAFPWRGKGQRVLSLQESWRFSGGVDRRQGGRARLRLASRPAAGCRCHRLPDATPCDRRRAATGEHVAQPGARSGDCQHQRRSRCLFDHPASTHDPLLPPGRAGLDSRRGPSEPPVEQLGPQPWHPRAGGGQ